VSVQRASDLALFLHLARACEQRRQSMERDKFLVLGGATAAQHGLHTIAGCCRRKILAQNTGHMIGDHPSFGAALADDDFLHYLRQLQRAYPREKMEHMLASLGIDLANEHATYASDAEYAAALLGTTLADLATADRSVPLPQGAPLPPPRTNWLAIAIWSGLLAALVAVGVWLALTW
jgi:hypothetical protein